MKVIGTASMAASRLNSWRTPSGATIRARAFLPSFARMMRIVSIWMTLLPRPKAWKSARWPPRTFQTTVARWCGLSSGLTSSGAQSRPVWAATATLAFRNAS
jgi:hypothetical protein